MPGNESLIKVITHYHLMTLQVRFLLTASIKPLPELLLVTAVNKDTHL
ncbi:hypothetical protein SAMN03097723_3671 [Pantoea eucalypti]|nr:hypothetical protein SAMN03097723_3671 [Pantoea eucalypti]